MLRLSITIRKADEARMSIEKLRAELEKSDIPTETKSFLTNAAGETLELWRTQLTRPNTKFLKADRVFEGNGYRVVLKARSKPAGIVGLLKRSLGIG
jgi:hypothetical protein